MVAQFSLKKPGAWLWSTGHTRATIEKKLAAGEISDEWRVCPHGDAARAITVREFLAHPAILEPVRMNAAAPPAPTGASPTSRRVMPFIVAVVCLLIALANAGWMFLIFLFGLPYLLVCAGHVVAHLTAAARGPRSTPMSVASNATLLLTFLLLPDTGDGSGWVAYKVVLGGAVKGSSAAMPPWWLPPWGIGVVFLVYLVITAWMVFGRRAETESPRGDTAVTSSNSDGA